MQGWGLRCAAAGPLIFPSAGGHRAALTACPPWALTDYKVELRDDPIINTHLAKLYDNLLEQNLIRVIEPFSRVQVGSQQALRGCAAVGGLGGLCKPAALRSPSTDTQREGEA